MPEPQKSHLRIAHDIGEQIMVSHFTEQQRRILDLIMRLSWGCGKDYAHIQHQSSFEIVGVLKGHVKSHLDWLVESRVIFRNDGYYSLNRNFDQWRVSRARDYTPGKVTELVTFNIKEKVTESVTSWLRNMEQVGYGIRNHLEAKPEAGIEKDINIIEKKEIYKERFDTFWREYPKKVGKGAAEKSFSKINPSAALLNKMIEAINKQKQSDQWIREKGQYIPNPSTWLNQKRWEDELSQGGVNGQNKVRYQRPEDHWK